MILLEFFDFMFLRGREESGYKYLDIKVKESRYYNLVSLVRIFYGIKGKRII